MEVFAAMLTHVDEQIGRVINTLEKTGQLDNTLIFVTSDNGSSAEGGLTGTFNETYVLNGLQTPFDANMSHFDDWADQAPIPISMQVGRWRVIRRSSTLNRLYIVAAFRMR